MVLDFELLGALNGLAAKSSVNQVNWQRGEDFIASDKLIGSEYLIRFPSSILSIAHIRPPDDQEYILFKMCSPDGRALTIERVPPSDPHWRLFLGLHESASHSPSLWRPLVSEIKEALDGSSVVGLEPDLATVEAAKKFFIMIAGKWHLRWNTGEENVRIDEFGNYYVIESDVEVNCFTLEKVLFDPSTNHVSYDKVSTGKRPASGTKGKRHAREVLDISADFLSMQGYDEQSRNTLKYARDQR
jgi:hypothetical protein